MSNQLKHPVIISGGGLVGLTLAQYLERVGIPYLLFERDESPDARYGGWGISINWVTPALQKCLTPEAFCAIKALHNDPRTLEEDTIPYQYFDLETGKAKTTHILPPQLRVSRLKLREILAQGVKINWGISVTGWEEVDDGVLVSLSDGKTVKGSILAGADGKNSNIKRKILGEEKAKLYTFPMGFVGLKMRLAPEKIAPFRNLSRIFFHGTHPNGKFIFFSTISTPEVNGSKGTENEYFEAQLNMSWNAGDATQDILNLPPAEKLKELKKAAKEGTGFFKELREGFDNIPDDTEVLDIVLQDWMTESWRSSASVTILGDAVHPMTMYRGEAANHGMFDAYMLGCQLHKVSMGEKDTAEAIQDFEREMISRAQEAVSLSRRAGFEVHDLDAISESSALFQYPHAQRLEALMSQ